MRKRIKMSKTVFLYCLFVFFLSLSSAVTQASQCLRNGAVVNAKKMDFVLQLIWYPMAVTGFELKVTIIIILYGRMMMTISVTEGYQ